MRQFFVKSDNVYVPDHMTGTKVISLDNPTAEALHAAIVERYGWPKGSVRFELWTNPMGFPRKRIDTVEGILPADVESVFFRAKPQRLASNGDDSGVLHFII
jgi:hypothetical protein